MSPAVWLFVFFLLLGLITPVLFILSSEGTESSELNQDENSSDSDETEASEPTEAEDTTEETNLESIVQDDGEQTDQTEPNQPEPSEETEEEVRLPTQENEPDDLAEKFTTLSDLEEDPSKQAQYNDRNDPDEPSHDLRAAVEWLIKANTEAIHEGKKRRTFLGYLRNYIRAPRAEGARTVAHTPWRDETPNMSRLIGERFLVMTLGLSAYGKVEMGAHKQAFLALLGDQWAEDELESPLLYQSIGRLGLLTPTPTSSLDEELGSRLSAQTIRGSNASESQIAHYHSLIAAVSPGDKYPFPRSEKGLSRLWHWDEHNPPLAELDFLPAVLYGLWVHYKTGGSTSQAANDFGAMLGNWWEEKDPSAEFFEENPRIWRSILLTGWVLLADQPIIWDQLRNRYQSLEIEKPFLHETTEAVLGWVDSFKESDEEPEQAFDRNVLPPMDWIRPLASDLISDQSTPPFAYPEQWCEQMIQPEHPTVENL